MLGIPVNECSSDGEETETDSTDKPEESRIRNLFGFLTWSGSGQSPTHMSNSASSWEIIGDSEANGEVEQRPCP
ncbi:hypothetical protein LDENG_00038170 [Lucifuga dentata]|nr:hypothetical protein LDENG_00038170 [Lucifuga dentata]